MKKGIPIIILCLFAFTGVQADSHYKYIHAWDAEIYFGHVTYPEAKQDGEDAIVLREGNRTPEIADLNLPLAPGDTIRTKGRRCEIQFDTGTILRLDQGSELKIETILARSLSSKNRLTNLLLMRGRVFVMYKQYIRKEMFQIITPNAAVKLEHKTVAMIDAQAGGSTDVVIKQGKAHMLYGPNENAIETNIVKKPQVISITAGHQMVKSRYEPAGDFEEWNAKINEEFLDLHEGKAVVPLPIQRLPDALYYFAQKYGSMHGEWLWDRFYGFVWRPFLNDHAFPGGGSWMPYSHGRWTSAQGQLFWVPYETWGWVPYHLGIWVWNEKKGWLWIPGSVFAPAWVEWMCSPGSFCWRPWTLMDWYGYGLYDSGQFPYFARWVGEDPQGDEVLPQQGQNLTRKVLSKSQLKSKNAPYPMPPEMKEAYRKVVVALQEGEDWVLSPIKEMPNHILVVDQKDINAPLIHEKAVKFADLPAERSKVFLSPSPVKQDPQNLAGQTFLRNEKMSALHQKIDILLKDLEGMRSLNTQPFQFSNVIAEPGSRDKRMMAPEDKALRLSGIQIEMSERKQIENPGRVAYGSLSVEPVKKSSEISLSLRSISRFRDWNPDVAVARRAGISIRYSSRTNEVRCPDLNISSRNVSGSLGNGGPRVRLTTRGSVVSSGSQGVVSSGSASSSSSSQGNSSSSNASNTGSKNAGSKGSSGGKIKK